MQDSLPDVVNCNGLHAGAVGAGLHFAEEEAGLTGGMAPDGDVSGVVQGIWAVFLGAGGAEDGNDRNVDGRRQVHGERDRADDPAGVVHQPDKLANVCLAYQIDNSLEARVEMPCFSALDKLYPPGEMIDHALVA